MIIDSSPPGRKHSQSNSNAEDNDQLRLNPGAPIRKPRSAGRFCLWLTILLVCLVGGTTVFFFVKGIVYQLRHPHSQMYYDKPESEINDWSIVVQPMIGKKDSFDIVASVWIRDDDGRDGGLYVDGKEQPERLIFSETVFRDLTLKSKNVLKNVTLAVPIAHFKQANISNYDLRASFVLVQHQPWWLARAQKYISWNPQNGLHAPAVRPSLGHKRTLEDEIYDSFGFTIPLIQFHNITGRLPGGSGTTSQDIPEPTGISEEDEEWDEEKEFLKEAEQEKAHKQFADDLMDIFRLDFTGDSKSVASKHPFIVARTHIGIIDETKLFKRQPYMFAQRELANKTCHELENPTWYQCQRWYFLNGVFETRVQIAGRRDDSSLKKNKFEFLYAPHLNAVKRSPGPKDLVPIPVNRDAEASDLTPTSLTSGEEYVNVTWRLSFRADNPGKHMVHAFLSKGKKDLNMTADDEELTHAQHAHDLTLGLLGYRIDEGAHPRRAHVLYFISLFVRAICWFLTIHYWYTRTSTAGISRLGTALIAFYILISANEEMLTSVFNPEGKGHWLSRVPISYIFLLIPPFVMLKAVTRLEFGSPGKGKEKKRGCIPKMYIAPATHWERASERIETRVSRRAKILFLISLFAIAHFFAGPYSYFITPRVPPPPPKAHPLHSLSDHIPTVLQHVYSLGLTFELGGTMLQFVMNTSSRTYAGKYKLVATLMLVANTLLLLDLLPHVVGTSARIGGVVVREMLGLGVSVVDFAQAIRYKSLKTSDTDGTVE
ncbi:hypothetical protein D9756_010607 [Leucocoprinus leucothites]|uniref:Uncharacterized protein n=1 Tax=Leucocoprinus leucothites TaxID=201217 RepID=A0A8H5CUG9_9AGAR|nr:hypothetical protein D9756_010607 [Leucoagaricus leucothites]